jgi:hypothetical protein
LRSDDIDRAFLAREPPAFRSTPGIVFPAFRGFGLAMTEFPVRLICPSGKSVNLLSSPSAKNISLRRLVETAIENHRPAPVRGTFRDRHERWVRDAVDAVTSSDE